MFDFVRTHTRLLQFVLVLLIFPSFVFFGIQGYSGFSDAGNATWPRSTARRSRRPSGTQAHQRQVERLRQQMPNIDVKLFDTPEPRGARRSSNLIRERVLLAAARQAATWRSATSGCARTFRSDPQFAGAAQPRRQARTRRSLQAQGMSAEMFEAQLRQELAHAPGAAAAWQQSAHRAGRAWPAARSMRCCSSAKSQVQRFDAKNYAAKVTPTDAELEAYYKAQRGAVPGARAGQHRVRGARPRQR